MLWLLSELCKNKSRSLLPIQDIYLKCVLDWWKIMWLFFYNIPPKSHLISWKDNFGLAKRSPHKEIRILSLYFCLLYGRIWCISSCSSPHAWLTRFFIWSSKSLERDWLNKRDTQCISSFYFMSQTFNLYPWNFTVGRMVVS